MRGLLRLALRFLPHAILALFRRTVGSWKLFVAARYLFSRGITYLATFSVLASVAVFVLTMGVLEGFAEHLKKTIRANSSHIDVSMPYVDGIQDYKSLGARIEKAEHIVGWTPYVRGPALIQSARYRFYGFVKGVDLARELRHGGIGPYIRIPRGLPELRRRAGLGEEDARKALDRLLDDEALEAVERSGSFTLKREPTSALALTKAGAFIVEMLRNGPVKMRDLLWDGTDFFALGKEEIEGALRKLIEEGIVAEGEGTLYVTGPGAELRYRGGRGGGGGGSPEERLLRAASSPPESFDPREGAELALPLSVVGEKIWQELELLPGDAVAFDVQAAEGRNNKMHFEVSGYFRTGSLLFDHWTLVKLEEAMKLFQTRSGVTGLGVWLNDYRRAYPVKKKLVELLRRYRIRTWWDQQSNLFAGMAIENRIMRVIFVGFIGLIGIFVGVILWVIVEEKVKDIGLLVALGSTRGGVTSIFVIDGLLIGIVGTALGLLAGVGLTLRVNEICDLLGWQPFPEIIFRVPRIPVRLVPFDLALVSAVAVLVSLLASVIPSMKAARMDPVECLRHEA